MKKPLLFAALAASSLTASAQVLMFDFGPTATTTPTNSPYHTANQSFTGTTWNQIGTADSSSLVYSNGAAATGISINLGASVSNTTLGTIALSTQPSGNSDLNNQIGHTNTGVYAGTSVGKDGIFHANTALTSPSRNVGSVGAQITGLPAGTYEVFFTGRNTNIVTFGSTGQIMTAYAGAGVANSSFSYGTYGFGTNTFASATSFTSSWVEGENYIKLSVTLLAGEALNIAAIGGGTAGGSTLDYRGFINSIQIVAIPEPASFSVLAGMIAVSAAGLRRRRA